MNRPKLENYEEWPFEMPYEYVEDIERYCYDLERRVKNLEDALTDHIKALNNACDMLAIYDLANQYEMKRAPKSAEQWKEWAFNERK